MGLLSQARGYVRVQLGFEFMSATCGNAVSLGWDEYLVVSVATGLVASF